MLLPTQTSKQPRGQPLRDRNAAFRSQQHQHHIEAGVHEVAVDFFNVLTGPPIAGGRSSALPEHPRTANTHPRHTLHVLETSAGARRSCRKLSMADCTTRAEGLSARVRILAHTAKPGSGFPVEMVSTLAHEVGGLLCGHSLRVAPGEDEQ